VKRSSHEAALNIFGWIIHRHAGWTVALVFCITVVFGAALPHLRFENVPGKLDLPSQDPARVQREYFESTFGRGETVIVGLEFDRDIDASGLRLIQNLTDDFGQVDGVTSVYSLANAVDFGWTSMLGINVLKPKSMIPAKVRDEDSTVERAIRTVAGNSLYRNALISGDGRSTAIIVTADPGEVSERTGIQPLRHLVDALQTKSRLAENEGVKVHIAGPSVLNIALQNSMRRDVSIFAPLSLVTFLIIMIVIFRAWRPVLAGFLTALIALIWSLGLLPLTGTPMSLGLSMIIPLVLSLSLMYSIHHLACVFRRPNDDAEKSRVACDDMLEIAYHAGHILWFDDQYRFSISGDQPAARYPGSRRLCGHRHYFCRIAGQFLPAGHAEPAEVAWQPRRTRSRRQLYHIPDQPTAAPRHTLPRATGWHYPHHRHGCRSRYIPPQGGDKSFGVPLPRPDCERILCIRGHSSGRRTPRGNPCRRSH